MLEQQGERETVGARAMEEVEVEEGEEEMVAGERIQGDWGKKQGRERGRVLDRLKESSCLMTEQRYRLDNLLSLSLHELLSPAATPREWEGGRERGRGRVGCIEGVGSDWFAYSGCCDTRFERLALFLSVSTHPSIHTHTHTPIHTLTHTDTHMDTHTDTPTQPPTHPHTHTYTRTPGNAVAAVFFSLSLNLSHSLSLSLSIYLSLSHTLSL
jgi:hypothetical protein